MKRQTAFTLVELLISLVVLMILISVANQSYHQLFSHQAIVASAERLYQFLGHAKSQSIKYNKKIFVHFCQQGTSQGWRMAQSEQSSCDCFVQNSCVVNGLEYNEVLSDGKLVFTSQNDITFTGLQASYSSMRFSVNAGSITLRDANENSLTVIQSVMRLRVCSADGDQFGYKQC